MTGVNPEQYTWVNGDRSATISVLDRGLAYGDGLFETMRFHKGAIKLAPWHINRLLTGCKRLGFVIEESAIQEQLNTVLADINTNCLAEIRTNLCILKLIITRGVGGKGYTPDFNCTPNLIWTLRAVESSDELALTGVGLIVSPLQLSRSIHLGGLKHLNRLEYVLASRQGAVQKAQQWLLLDASDRVVETLAHNIFWVKHGTLVTPDTTYSGVAGVMRQWILEQALSLGLPSSEGDFALSELDAADEIFICNSVRGIWPVVQLENNFFKPGPITRQLQAKLDQFWL